MKSVNLKERFYAELLELGAYALLPANLNDEWLDFLTRQAFLISNQNNNSEFSEVLAAVLSILLMKSNCQLFNFDESELMNYLHLYSIELYAEMMSRNGNAKIAGATMETILTEASYHKTTQLVELWDTK
jgi:hypothetical protein